MSRRGRSPRGDPVSARRSPLFWGIVLAVALVAISLGNLHLGAASQVDLGATLRGGLAAIGLGEPLPGTLQTIAELRWFRLLTSIGVGAALALSGALLQGIFRNQLASPSIIGVTSGASLGASLMILLVSGSVGGFFQTQSMAGMVPLFVSLAAFGLIGPLAAAVLMPLSSLTVVTSSYRSRTFGSSR